MVPARHESRRRRIPVPGTSNVKTSPDGTYQVILYIGYTWNNVLDPNYEYTTDRRKSRFAEIITLGRLTRTTCISPGTPRPPSSSTRTARSWT
jgi:hypothetical protein